MSTPTFKVEHIQQLFAPRQAFNDAYINSQGDEAVRKACKFMMLPPGVTEVDLGLLLKQGLPEKVTGGRVNFGETKEYENKWSLDHYAWTMELTDDQVKYMDTRGLDYLTHVRDAARKHITLASRNVGQVIRGAAGESGYLEIQSKVDDASSVLLFGDGSAATHILSGTSDTNWRSTNPIEDDTTLANAYSYLQSAVAEWENLPDSDGIAAGAGNNFLANGMVLCASDIYNTLLSIQKRQTISADNDNIYYNGFNLVRVPGMEDSTLVITRDPSKGYTAGFYWCMSPDEDVHYSAPGDPAGYFTHRWVSGMRWRIVPTSWQYSLLLK